MKLVPGRSLSFDPVAGDYDRTRVIPKPIREDIAALCADFAHLNDGGLFLDAGVGTGRFAAPLAQIAPGQIIGVDLSLAMMGQATQKAPSGSVHLAQANLQRLPFRDGVFSGALLVHILHLIERWPLVLDELRRALAPRRSVLLLGVEMGSRSRLVDYYYERARAAGVLAQPLGAASLTPVLAYLRQSAQIEQVASPNLVWKRYVTVEDVLGALFRRTYSQMWNIPEDAHQKLLAETRDYALRTFGDESAVETLNARFDLHTVRWL